MADKTIARNEMIHKLEIVIKSLRQIIHNHDHNCRDLVVLSVVFIKFPFTRMTDQISSRIRTVMFSL